MGDPKIRESLDEQIVHEEIECAKKALDEFDQLMRTASSDLFKKVDAAGKALAEKWRGKILKLRGKKLGIVKNVELTINNSAANFDLGCVIFLEGHGENEGIRMQLDAFMLFDPDVEDV